MPAILATFAVSAGPMLAQPVSTRPDTVVQRENGLRIVFFRPSGPSNVVSLRLFVPLVESVGGPGGGALLAGLAERRMADAIGTTSARVSVSHSPWGIGYGADGAEIDLDFLGFLMRTGAGPPAPGSANLAELIALQSEEMSGQEESPAEHLVALLVSEARSQGGAASGRTRGAGSGYRRSSWGALRELWAETHTHARMTLFVHSAAEPAVVLAAIGPLGNPEDPPVLARPPVPSSRPPDAPPVIRRWHGAAWSDNSPLDPRAQVLARLIASRLRAGSFEAEVAARMVVLEDRTVVFVTGAAYNRGSSQVRSQIRGAVSSIAETLTEAEVRRTARAVALDYWSKLTSPGGWMEAMSEAYAATGNLEALDERLRSLDELGLPGMLVYIAGLNGPFLADLGE